MVLVVIYAMALTQVTAIAWAAHGLGGGPATQINAVPEGETNPVGTLHFIGVFAGDSAGQPTTSTSIRGDILPGSPNANDQATQAELVCAADSSAEPGITFPEGQSQTHECSYTGNMTGFDSVRLFADTNSNGIFEQGEPFDDVQKTWSGPAFAVELTAGDSAGAGTCNELTARVTDEQGNPVMGEQIDIAQILQDAGTEPSETRELAFCNPLNPQGSNPTGQGGTSFGDVLGNNQSQIAGEAGRNTTVHAEAGPTNSNGEVTFGITINHVTENATVSVRAWIDVGGDNDRFGEGEPTDEPSEAIWTAADPASVTALGASPEAATNANGSEHQVSVTVMGADGPMPGITPNSMIQSSAAGRPPGDVADPDAGTSPNAAANQGNFNVYSCTPSNVQGDSTCTFLDPTVSPAGTDTVIFYVNQPSGGGIGPDAEEPQDGVQKSWLSPTIHQRQISVSFDHAGGGENPVLVAAGRLSANDDFEDCLSNQLVIVQRRIGERWVTKKTTATNGNGRYAVEMSDRRGRYRALATRVEFSSPADDKVHICARVAKEKIHRHT